MFLVRPAPYLLHMFENLRCNTPYFDALLQSLDIVFSFKKCEASVCINLAQNLNLIYPWVSWEKREPRVCLSTKQSFLICFPSTVLFLNRQSFLSSHTVGTFEFMISGFHKNRLFGVIKIQSAFVVIQNKKKILADARNDRITIHPSSSSNTVRFTAHIALHPSDKIRVEILPECHFNSVVLLHWSIDPPNAKKGTICCSIHEPNLQTINIKSPRKVASKYTSVPLKISTDIQKNVSVLQNMLRTKNCAVGFHVQNVQLHRLLPILLHLVAVFPAKHVPHGWTVVQSGKNRLVCVPATSFEQVKSELLTCLVRPQFVSQWQWQCDSLEQYSEWILLPMTTDATLLKLLLSCHPAPLAEAQYPFRAGMQLLHVLKNPLESTTGAQSESDVQQAKYLFPKK